jgi:hypothetical protein
MKPSQAFGLVVRVIGLFGWLAAFFYLVSAVVVLAAPDFRPGVRPWWHYLISAAVLFLVGWFAGVFVRRNRVRVRLAAALIDVGRAPTRLRLTQKCDLAPGPHGSATGALTLRTLPPSVATLGPHVHSGGR